MTLGVDNQIWWAIGAVVLLPFLILAASEIEERLRQSESPFRDAFQTLRVWGLPATTIWVLMVPVLGVDSDALPVRITASFALLSLAAAFAQALRVLVSTIRTQSRTGDRATVPELLLLLPRIILIVATGWVLVQSIWGVNLSAAMTALGVTSLVVSFALQDTLSGLASGMLLLTDQPIQPGHWIKVGDTEGQVVDINWRTTRIRTRNNDVVIVPNSELAGSSIINYTSEGSLHRVVVSVQVAYANPPTLAKAMLLDAARGVEGVLEEPAPQAVINQVDDPLMGYSVHMWINDYAIAPRVESDFGSLVWYQSHRHAVPLPSPAQDLFLHDGDAEAPEMTVAERRQNLVVSPLLESMDDGDLDRLAAGARVDRFAAGEVVVSVSDDVAGDLLVVSAGRARLLVTGTASGVGTGDQAAVTDIVPGDLIGSFVDTPPAGCRFDVVALDDCEVATVDNEQVSEVAGVNAGFAAALTRQGAARKRRAERAIDRQVLDQIAIQAEVTRQVVEGESR